MTIKNEIMKATNLYTGDILRAYSKGLDLRPSTRQSYLRGIRRLKRWHAVNAPALPFNRDLAHMYADFLRDTYKPTTVSLYLQSARSFFEWASEEIEGVQNPFKRVRLPHLSKAHKRRHFSAEQIQALLAHTDPHTITGLRDRALITLAATAGLRAIEMHRATVSDIETIEGVAFLRVQGKGQDEKADLVRIEGHSIQALQRYLNARDPILEGAPLFANHAHNRKQDTLSTRSISTIVSAAKTRAGINDPKLTAHSLRHTAITLAIMHGQRLDKVQAFARHANLNTTMIYNHAVEVMRNDTADTIASAIFET